MAFQGFMLVLGLGFAVGCAIYAAVSGYQVEQPYQQPYQHRALPSPNHYIPSNQRNPSNQRARRRRNIKNDTCPICLNELKGDSTDFAQLAPCGHCFHRYCIDRWFFNPMSERKCPCCRIVTGYDQRARLRRNMKDDTCSICLNELKDYSPDFAQLQECGHCFHRPCIKQWLLNPKSERKCPCCRTITAYV